MKNVKFLLTLVSTVMAGRIAVVRILQARRDRDSFEMADAVLNAIVAVSGTIIIIRRLRSLDEDEE